MPYIKKGSRTRIAQFADPTSAGELNYIITLQVIRYLSLNGLSYQTCNDIVGALDNAKDEFRRRVQHPYETDKEKENGDVGYEAFQS